MTDEPDSIFYPGQTSVMLYDYIDADGDLISVDVFDEEWLAVSIRKHGMGAVLAVIFTDADEARKMAGCLVSWADAMDSAQ